LEEERAIDARLADLPAPAPTGDVWAVVEASVSRHKSGRRQVAGEVRGWLPGVFRLLSWFTLPRRILAVAVVVAVAVVLVFVSPIRQSRDHEQIVTNIVQNQAASQSVERWTDDPLGSQTDQVLAAIREEL